MLKVAKRAAIPSEKIWVLLVELQADQMPDKTIENISKNVKKYKKFGDMLPASLALTYLEVSQLSSILQVSKNWNSGLKNCVLKKILLETVSHSSRAKCWEYILIA